jgi:CheY-like chemotaxis protein
MSDLVDDQLRDTDNDADDMDLPDLMSARYERITYVTNTERLASADSRRDPRLPVSRDRARGLLPYPPDESGQDEGSSTLRVLILEDDPAMQEVFSLLLGPEEGFQVDCVSEVATCLEHLRSPSAWSDSGSDAPTSSERRPQRPFEVMLLDVRLRGGHLGTEVFTAAQKDPGLHLPPMVICTALADRALAAIVQDCGVDLRAHDVRVVPKPFDMTPSPPSCAGQPVPGVRSLPAHRSGLGTVQACTRHSVGGDV